MAPAIPLPIAGLPAVDIPLFAESDDVGPGGLSPDLVALVIAFPVLLLLASTLFVYILRRPRHGGISILQTIFASSPVPASVSKPLLVGGTPSDAWSAPSTPRHESDPFSKTASRPVPATASSGVRLVPGQDFGGYGFSLRRSTSRGVRRQQQRNSKFSIMCRGDEDPSVRTSQSFGALDLCTPASSGSVADVPSIRVFSSSGAITDLATGLASLPSIERFQNACAAHRAALRRESASAPAIGLGLLPARAPLRTISAPQASFAVYIDTPAGADAHDAPRGADSAPNLKRAPSRRAVEGSAGKENAFTSDIAGKDSALVHARPGAADKPDRAHHRRGRFFDTDGKENIVDTQPELERSPLGDSTWWE